MTQLILNVPEHAKQYCFESKGEIREEFKRNATSMDYTNDRSVYDLHYNKIHKDLMGTIPLCYTNIIVY